MHLTFYIETSSISKVFTLFEITSRYPPLEGPFDGVSRTQNLWGWLLILGLKKGLVECARVCSRSEVILTYYS